MKELKWNIKTCWSKHHYHRFYVSLSLIIDILRATEQQPNMLAGNIISLYLVARFYYALLVSSVFFSSHMKSIGMRSFYEMYAHWKEEKRMNGNTRLTEIADFMQKFQHDMKWSFDSRPRKTQFLWSFLSNDEAYERLLTKNYKLFITFWKRIIAPQNNGIKNSNPKGLFIQKTHKSKLEEILLSMNSKKPQIYWMNKIFRNSYCRPPQITCAWMEEMRWNILFRYQIWSVTMLK